MLCLQEQISGMRLTISHEDVGCEPEQWQVRLSVMSSMINCLRILGILAFMTTVVNGRPPSYGPTFTELLEKSDLVCILQVKSIQESSKPHPDIPSPDDAKWYMAKCRTVCAFKGDTKTNEVQIPFYGHFFGEPEFRFKSPLVENSKRSDKSIQYLAFLKNGPDGLFYPTSGHLDPGFSFRILLGSNYGEVYDFLKKRQVPMSIDQTNTPAVDSQEH